MNRNTLITIITVNLNNLRGLKKTMKSIISQTYKDFEFIVIDGGSTDGSKEYIEKYSSNINYWLSEPDQGIYMAMNKGIKGSAGEYLLFLNSGDHFFSKETLMEIKNYLKLYDLISFNLEILEKEKSQIASNPSELRFSDLYYGTLYHPSTFIKKELFDKVGLYDEHLKIVSDWKFFILALFKYNCSYRKVDITLSTFYKDGISSNPKNKDAIDKEREGVLNTHFKAFLTDIKELHQLRIVIKNLKKSKKIKLLLKWGLLNKF